MNTTTHTINLIALPTLDDPNRYRWECSCGAAGTAPGWVDNAPEFHLPAGDIIAYHYPAPEA